MKLKYYLRGLGIGMIVTALILGISFSNRQDQTSQIMTDDQIRERAAELGMVDSSELTLAALQNSAKQPTEGTPEETTQTQEQNNIEAEPETTVPAETQATVEPETTQESEATTEPEKTAGPETTAEPEVTEAPQRTQTASITIQRGDDSGSASRRLYEAGLVENAKAFDNYLCNNGYSRSINPGTYEIAPGTSEEEIAKIITGKH
ncbi:hypothetical protein [Waltera acetigignens]|jgi:tolA domain protein|uniref:hypothetical protein n=1 Tax=Waltera acetigignens TaxID=2981769 RepID=UPI0021D11D1E|nr:hypothetical protein [Brotolimicola acetigignens]MBS5464405.1 hypothetical protein [Clostridium sp.]MCU6757307.1 hypothetical protein [Brotolimicola acetigignens]